MYTKDQFNRLLRTRKHWTGKQVGRAIIQSDVEQLNGKEPFATIDEMQGIIDALTKPEDIGQYTLYTNMYSGIINAWNYIDANGNDAIANLSIMRTVIANFTDYANAEDFHKQQPVMITQADFEKYKEQYNKKHKEYMDNIENELHPFLELIDANEIMDDDWRFSVKKKARSYGKNASKVIESYQDKYFTDDEVNYIRDIMQATVVEGERRRKEYKKAHKDDLQPTSFYDDVDSTYQFIVASYDSLRYVNQALNRPGLTDERKEALKATKKRAIKSIEESWKLINRYKRSFDTNDIEGVTSKYISLIKQEQLKTLYSKDVSFKEALNLALKKYPYDFKPSNRDVPQDDKTERYPDIPFVPDKLSYADLLYANEKTANIASSFFDYLYMIGKGKDTTKQKELDKFFRVHFSKFIEATKKDLIKKYPKLDNVLNKATNSTSYIIPYITTKSLATAGIEWANEYISDAESGVKFTDVFPKEEREQARLFGFAVIHSHYPDEENSDDRQKITTLADMPVEQHYDIPEFIERTLKNMSKELEASVKTIRRFAVLQRAYEDYFKGVARIANDKGFREYDKTTAYPKLQNAIEEYEKELYNLIATLHGIIDDPDVETKLISLIKKHLPLVNLTPIKYKHKTIKELASLLESSYLSSTPNNIMSIFNIIAKGAEW